MFVYRINKRKESQKTPKRVNYLIICIFFVSNVPEIKNLITYRSTKTDKAFYTKYFSVLNLFDLSRV